MHKILVRLPMDRDYAGLLEVQTPGGTRIAGPYEVCGRADDQLARDHRNPERNPLLPFGDIPYGEYWVAGLKGSGAGTEYASEEYGPACVVLLEPRNGDAALADANGRFRFLIHGGKPASQGGLRPTDGSLRLSNRDQRDLVGVLRRLERSEGTCLVVQADHLRTRPVVTAPADLEPRFARIVSALSMSNLSRRSRTLGVFWLRAMMGATYALVAARSAFGFSLSNTQADPAGDLRSALLAKGASSSLSGKPNFARGRLYAQGGGDYTQQAPEEQEQAPAPQEQAPAAQEPGTNTDAMQQLQNTEQSSQQAAQNPSLEGAHEQASQPFDQGGQPAPAAPPVPAPAPVEAAPQEETPAPQDEEQQPEEETPAPQDEEQQPEEEAPVPEERQAPEEETPSAPEYQAPTPAQSPAPAWTAPAVVAPATRNTGPAAPAAPQRGNLYVDPASLQKYLQPAPVQKAPAYDPAKVDAEIKGIKQALDRLKSVSAANLARSAEWLKASNDATKDAWDNGKNLTIDLLVAGLKSNAGTLDKEMQRQVDAIINTSDPAKKKALQEAFMGMADHKEQLQKAYESLEYAHKGTDVLTLVDKNYSPADSGEEKTRWEKVNKQLENASDVLQLVAPGQTGLIKSYVDAGYDIWVQSVAVMQVNSANQGQTQYLKAVTVLTQRMQVLVDLKKKNGLPPQAGD